MPLNTSQSAVELANLKEESFLLCSLLQPVLLLLDSLLIERVVISANSFSIECKNFPSSSINKVMESNIGNILLSPKWSHSLRNCDLKYVLDGF